MAYVFDGRKFAKEKERALKRTVFSLQEKRITPTLVAILTGENPASKLYVALKKKAAERIGVKFKLIRLSKVSKEELIHLIKEYNQSNEVHGIMVQLPIEGINSRETTREILLSIDPKKDVDGESGSGNYPAATVRAILYAVIDAQSRGFLANWSEIIACVVGATGMVGSALVKELEAKSVRVIKCNTKTLDLTKELAYASLVVSCTGVESIIKKNMVKPGAVVIDVGSPKADVEESVREIASFITPVPGGIGPMTVVCLLENTVDAASLT
ncbi:MAG: methylenetetrahydrofolate dehydrogenase (NADP+) / methenyltetrahydrofolate cyclohydrolase [Microgenomates group bacterium Gr01-1014_5]|nr:MAG: methylenetetrahydrofolate dehydrogenase (NADP+) / methenyltetrahydrofolate cyclohydrolase [Microgenomates group bacterium Gr01-1014_5]